MAISLQYRSSLINFMLFLSISITLGASHSCAHSTSFPLPVPSSGLSYGFYHASCPYAEQIVRKTVQSFLAPNISQAGSLIRLVFHDCFVQGCDASLLLADATGEQSAPPNLTLRPQALALIEQIKQQLEASCPNTVSCADVIVMAGRDATQQAGGPYFDVPTGRLDSLGFAAQQTVLEDLPSPTSNFTVLSQHFNNLGLNNGDLVSLSGAHTVGLAHCAAFNDSILPTVQSGLDASFAQTLLQVCPNAQSNQETVQDPVTPNAFDNQYYKNLQAGKVLFDSDRALIQDEDSAATVAMFAANEAKFFEQYAWSFVKMSMMAVKTASTGNGNIRKVCSLLNGTNSTLSGVSMMYTAQDTLQ